MHIIAISVVTLDRIRLNDNQYGELLLQFEHWKDKMSDNQYGELLV